MVRRTLIGQVESHLQPQRSGGLYEMIKIFQGAEIRVNRFMAALRRTDRPRRPGISRAGLKLVMGSFTKTFADGMHRWKIDDGKSHLRNSEEASFGFAQRGAPILLCPCRARKHFIPGTKLRLRILHL